MADTLTPIENDQVYSFSMAVLKDATTHGCTFADCDFTAAQLNGSVHAATAFLNGQSRSANLFSARFSDQPRSVSRLRSPRCWREES